MPRLNVLDAQDAYLSGYATFKKFMTDFITQWYGQATIQAVGASYAQLDPAVKDKLKEINPQMVEQMDKMFVKE
jgi:hypothetical protein